MAHLSLFRSALILALLSAVGPLAIDLYLPALPAIQDSLGAAEAGTQATLSLYFIGFGLAQLIYGPLADQVGRKPPLYVGLGIFGVASVACALAPTVETLAIARLVQGLGGAAVMVVPRAVIRDLHTGNEATRLMAMIMLVISVSPMLAPYLGSLLLKLGDWRLIFWVLVGATLVCLVILATALPETLAPSRRRPVNIRNLASGCLHLLTHREFMLLTFVGGFGMASFFVFLASAPFVYTGQFGLSTDEFALAFAVNALGFFAASQAAAPLGMRFGAMPVLIRGTMGFAIFALALLGLSFAGLASLPVIIAMLFLANACLGLVIPTGMVLALEEHGEMAGLASSLGGTLQMLAGGLMVIAAGPFFDGTARPMIATIAICAVLAFGLALFLKTTSTKLSTSD